MHIVRIHSWKPWAGDTDPNSKVLSFEDTVVEDLEAALKLVESVGNKMVKVFDDLERVVHCSPDLGGAQDTYA